MQDVAERKAHGAAILPVSPFRAMPPPAKITRIRHSPGPLMALYCPTGCPRPMLERPIFVLSFLLSQLPFQRRHLLPRFRQLVHPSLATSSSSSSSSPSSSSSSSLPAPTAPTSTSATVAAPALAQHEPAPALGFWILGYLRFKI